METARPTVVVLSYMLPLRVDILLFLLFHARSDIRESEEFDPAVDSICDALSAICG